MYLKALEIQGFKSFADKTRLTFEKDITAIVGPNGSGKSNISDALLWVMGEQRSKALRGTKMEDVIFGGTQKRSPLGFAQVSLIIDNSAHIFAVDTEEIILTRRYYRSGESEYFINRESVRLRDINSLLMDTGLGRDGYSVIGQGRIAEIVSTKSTDRREVFEEAAGISRYRYRKEEAERKLEKTEDNLLRVNDKIEELELQVVPLRKQAETAKKYLILRDELRGKEISVWMVTLERLHEQAEKIRLEYDQTVAELERTRNELDALYASGSSITERMHQKDIEAERERDRLSVSENRAAEAESSLAVLTASIRNEEANRSQMLRDIQEQQGRVQELSERIAAADRRIEELRGVSEELRVQLANNGNVIAGCRMKLQGREEALNALHERSNRLAVEVRTMEGRIRMLADMERDFEGYSKAVKTVMREKSRGNLRGIHAPVANLVRAKEECALAIETALGASAQHIVVDSQQVGKAAIETLERLDAGRATFLPLDTIRGSVMNNAPTDDPGFVGIAYDLVSFDPRYATIMANLLGRTVVAETMSDAIRMSRRSNHSLRIVTLNGQQINSGGSMTGGSSSRSAGILSRANELEKLRKQQGKAEEENKKCLDELEKAKSALSAVRYQLDMAQEDQSSLLSRRSSAEAELRTTEESRNALSRVLVALSGDSEGRKKTVERLSEEITALEAEAGGRAQELAGFREESAKIREGIQSIVRERLELEGRRTRAEKDAQEHSAAIIDLERRSARIEQKKLSSEMEEKGILDKLWDNYELSFTAAQALRQPVENLPKANREISDLRRQINALGPPNLGAIEQYEQVNTRYEFLIGQRDDVEKAKKELLGIIHELTAEMKTIFTERFREIDASFRQTFLELFGGGKAALVLEDEENVLECGIEIKVQPPGKALSTISLMSGGEMAFVAIALYFAILRVRPTPFCVMDEIEAALDEANVARYASYMRRMAEKTQFLVITHRRGTMEEADMLYGVTMQEKGVSSVIELDLETAQKTIEEK